MESHVGERAAWPYIVTTSQNPGPGMQGEAEKLARHLGVPFAARERRSLKVILGLYGAAGAVVVDRERITYRNGQGEFFFHPDKSPLRIKALQAGKTDQMIKAMDLQPGYAILDCTLGLGADAIVAAYAAGNTGRVVGLESSPVIAALVERGLKNYTRGKPETIEAMRRVRVLCVEHGRYLAHSAPGSFDIVYFDPMFRRSRHRGHYPVDVLRPLADYRPLQPPVIRAALRAARKRVVMKESRESNEFKRLGAHMVVGGNYSPVHYGIWFAEGGNGHG